ncbi:hypothetical protein [Cognatiyoonia sp.]|uniref:hypothetical protein n=1 Tax=Cognatiyoonia sp. TaxID=2211652 RepID=UPI003F6A36DC
MTFVKLAAAAALAVSATTATAGGLAPEVVEAPVVVVDAPAPTSSLAGLIVPAILLALIFVAATAEDDSMSD